MYFRIKDHIVCLNSISHVAKEYFHGHSIRINLKNTEDSICIQFYGDEAEKDAAFEKLFAALQTLKGEI